MRDPAKHNVPTVFTYVYYKRSMIYAKLNFHASSSQTTLPYLLVEKKLHLVGWSNFSKLYYVVEC